MGRSIAAIVTGFVTIAVLSLGTDVIVGQFVPGFFQPGHRVESVPLLLFVVAYVGAFAVFGCWLTARLAPRAPMTHALILGALGLAFNVMGTVSMWGTAPAWYHILSLLLVMPYAWLGGKLRERQLAGERVPVALGA